MKKSALKNYERALKWDKVKVEKAMNEIIYSRANELITTQIDIGLTDRNPQAINSVLDRAFGKARQNIGLDGGSADKPIVFMPAQLMAKYEIDKAMQKIALPSSTEE
jgi:hypothetical protein